MFLNFEFYVLDLVNTLRCDFLNSFMIFITSLGNSGVIWIIVGAFLLVFKKTRKAGITVLLALALGFIVCNIILKPIVARPRPFDVRDIVPLIPKPSDFSFPSGHSCSSFAAATAVFLTNRKYGVFAYVLAGLIAFSRLYLNVHFPTDVLFGILLGIASAFASHRIMKNLKV